MSHRRIFLLYATVTALSFSSTEATTGSLTWNSLAAALKLTSKDKTVVTEFSFRNSSRRPVQVLSVTPSCDCLTVKPDKTVYAPGDAGTIRVEFTVGGAEGQMERFIDVTTDDAPSQPQRLRLTIELPEPVALRPRFVFWQVGEAVSEKEIEVILAEPKTSALGEVLCTESAFGARLVGSDANGHYRVKITPTSTATITQATIRLNATLDGQPRVFILYAAVK